MKYIMNNKWHEKYLFEKNDRAVVKLRHKDGSFWRSIIIPTDKYPLNGQYEVFTYNNTERISDEKVLSIFDRNIFDVGRCYHNAEILSEDLKKEGYPAVTYAGWLFTDESELPIHHCWTVLNGKHVLDPSDFFTVLFSGENIKHFENARNKDECVALMGDFMKAAKKEKNHIVCYPVGLPSSNFLYIGSPCSPDYARQIYQELMRKFPDHECDRTDRNGLNATQRILVKNGFMEL